MNTTNSNHQPKSYVNSSPQPRHYKLSLDCHHQPVMSVEDIKASYVEARANYNDMSRDHVIVCPLCKVHAPGSCNYTPLHKVVYMTPLYSKQVKEEQEHEHHQHHQLQV
jgi:hypothetical protein